MRDMSMDFVTSILKILTFFFFNLKKELGTMSFKTCEHIFRVMA